MALFTDGNVSTLLDLRKYEGGILETAIGEGVDLNAKLAIAQQEIGLELQAFLSRHGGIGKTWDLKHVVVTPGLRYWHVLRTMSLVYQEAYSGQLNDRYQGRWKEYRRLATEASRLLYETGVGIAYSPLERPPAPEAGHMAGTNPAGVYYVRCTWVNARGVESAPSETVLYSAPNFSRLVVKAGLAPENATGWNVYVGRSEVYCALQNSEPLEIDATWTIDGAEPIKGRPNGDGQAPDRLLTPDRRLERG